MKTLYIDCGMGAAGDMLTAALLEIECRSELTGRADRDKIEGFAVKFNAIGIPGVEMKAVESEKMGVKGTHVHIFVNGEEEHEPGVHENAHVHEHDHGDGHVHSYEHTHVHEHIHTHEHTHEHIHTHEQAHEHEHDHDHRHHHVHRSMKDIEQLVGSLEVDEEVKADVLNVYKLIAEAEGSVHGMPAGEVHFHEVGTMDAVADVTAVCMLMREIAPDEVIASPVATGYGSVRCAHGVLPVPAPATALLLRGVPAYAGDIEGELCTPTGAALIKYFAQKFSQLPVMSTEAIGYGLGTKDFKRANMVRVFYGEAVHI